jgi:potassium channel subfamily K
VKCATVVAALLAVGMVGFVPFESAWEGSVYHDDAAPSQLGDRVLLSLYFSVVTLTTVGFGDIVPVHPAAKIFVCAYIVCGISALGYVLSSAVESLLEVQAQSFLHAIDRTQASRVLSSRRSFRAARAVIVLSVTIAAGATFYWSAKDDRQIVDCVYFAVVTATTVGYGDFQPVSDGERAGAAVYCLVSTSVVAWCLSVLVDCLINLEGAERQREIAMLFNRASAADLRAADMDQDGVVSEAEYVLMKLKHMGKTTDGEIAAIRSRFSSRDLDGDKLLSIDESGEVF